jgi:hypothetical protein
MGREKAEIKSRQKWLKRRKGRIDAADSDRLIRLSAGRGTPFKTGKLSNPSSSCLLDGSATRRADLHVAGQ